MELRVGVLALQGSFREHASQLKRIPGVVPVEVRTVDDLESVVGLIIPGQWCDCPSRPGGGL
jgi:5'-phosphate synthase pdxT subunit